MYSGGTHAGTEGIPEHVLFLLALASVQDCFDLAHVERIGTEVRLHLVPRQYFVQPDAIERIRIDPFVDQRLLPDVAQRCQDQLDGFALDAEGHDPLAQKWRRNGPVLSDNPGPPGSGRVTEAGTR